MKRILTMAAACAIAVPVWAQNAAVVNGKPIPASQVDEFVQMMIEQGAPDSPQLREQVREELINRAVMSQAAENAKIAEKPSVKAELDLARQSVLIRGLFADFLEKNPISEKELQAEYDRLKAANQHLEYNARHILVQDEAKAREIIAKLKDGADFAALAKEHSADPGSGGRGGELGWSAADNYVQPFADALRKLEKGQTTSEPVESSFGWHVIQLEDSREAQFPNFDQVKPQLEEMMRQQALAKYQEQLRNDAKVE